MGEDAWSAETYAARARFVSDLGTPALELLAPKPGERVLDLGCGDGALTAALAAAGAEVVGVDASPDMVAAARARGLDVRVGDAAALSFEAEFDAVFSNAALHWVVEAETAVAGIARALRPGGRFVAEFGGFGNVAAIHTALVAVFARHGVETSLRDIWFFPRPEAYRALLATHGFAVREIALIPRQTRLEHGMAAWLETLAAPLLARVGLGGRADVVAELEAVLSPALKDADGAWWADYVRLRVAARKED